MEKKAGYFGNSGALFATLSIKDDKSHSYCWKTSQLSLFEDWDKCLGRFPESGIMQNGSLYQQKTLGPVILENDGSLLPTPQARTPNNNPSTPGAWNQKDDLNVETAKMMGFTKKTIGKKSRLNPRFVRWMMGFPIGWLELEP